MRDNYTNDLQETCKKLTSKEVEVDKEKDIETPTPDGAEDDISFQEFYNLFPRHEGKAAAQKAWKKIKQKEKPVLIDALQKQIVTQHINTIDKKYCPMPATWLNQRRWEDEITLKRGVQKPSPQITVNCYFCKPKTDHLGIDEYPQVTVDDPNKTGKAARCPKCKELLFKKLDDGTWTERYPERAAGDTGEMVAKIADKLKLV